MYPKTHSTLLALIALVAFATTACGIFDDDPVAPPPAAPAPAAEAPPKKPAPVVAKKPEVEETKRKEYPQGRRDPFVFSPPPPTTEDAQEDRELGPLEHFEVNQLKLVAIVTGTALPKAMLVDSTGFGHVAKEGDRIGRNGGRITAIRDNEVEITVSPSQASASDDPDSAEDGNPEETESAPIIIRLSDTELELDKGSASNDALIEDLDLDGNKKAGNGSRVQ